MKVAMINGSPKAQNSNSGYLLELLQARLPKDWEFTTYKPIKPSEYTLTLAEVPRRDILVISFPLYVDSLPSHLLKLLTELEAAFKANPPQKPVHVYVMINCGFFEGHQNAIAAEIVKHWAHRAGLVWGRVLMTGAGEMLGQTKNVPMGHGPNKNIHKALNSLAVSITTYESGEDICINPNFPRPLFIFMANRMWGFMIKKNGLKRKDLYTQ